MIFPNGTIRVLSPVTEDGSRPKIDPVLKTQIFREDYFPLSAKRAFEHQNAQLPEHLKKTIEVLDGGVQATGVKSEAKNKPGPKPKEHAQTN